MFTIQSIITMARKNPKKVASIIMLKYLLYSLLVHRYQRGPIRQYAPSILEGKVVIITGCSSGIGQQTALALAKQQGTIIFACRNKERTQKVMKEIELKTGNSKLHFIQLELDNYDSIPLFVNEFRAKFDRLDILINNAGMGLLKVEFNKQHHERVFAANYLGHFKLTYLLLEILAATPQSRIINVSSVMHTTLKNKVNFQNVLDGKYIESYTHSKLAQILFTIKLQDYLNQKNIECKVISLHPGVVRTEFLNKTMTNYILWIAYKVAFAILGPFTLSEEEGAMTTVYTSLMEFNELQGGGYYEKNGISRYSKDVTRNDQSQELWDFSLRVLELEMEQKY